MSFDAGTAPQALSPARPIETLTYREGDDLFDAVIARPAGEEMEMDTGEDDGGSSDGGSSDGGSSTSG